MSTKTMTGVVTRVEEERFQLSDDAHNARVFTLALDARVEPGTIEELRRSGRRVTVEYDDEPDATTHVVRRVFATPSSA